MTITQPDPIPDPYLRLIREYRPELAGGEMQLNRDGLANDVVIVNREWCFRFPKNDAGHQALARESKILHVVQQHVALPTPRFEWLGEQCVLYHFIDGEPLSRNTLLRQDRFIQDRVAEQLARFLRELHTISTAALASLSLPAPAQPTPDEWLTRFETIERQLYPFLWADQKAWLAELFGPVRSGALDLRFEPALIHDDLAAYHMLFDPVAGQLSGVIDFGVASLGDPASDFALLINTLGESFVQRMIPHYPAIEAALDRARFHAGMLELWWMQQGLATNDLSWFMVHIGRARDVMPIAK